MPNSAGAAELLPSSSSMGALGSSSRESPAWHASDLEAQPFRLSLSNSSEDADASLAVSVFALLDETTG